MEANAALALPAGSWSSLVDSVGEAPAAPGVAVSVSRVDEAVLERSADVVSRQARHRGHHVPGELADLQGPFVLATPPVVLRPEGGGGGGEWSKPAPLAVPRHRRTESQPTSPR